MAKEKAPPEGPVPANNQVLWQIPDGEKVDASKLQDLLETLSGLKCDTYIYEKKKNDLIEGEKMNLIEAELNDLQREFDRSRDIFIKTTHQFLQVKTEVNDLWLKLKNSVNKSS